MLHPCKKCGSVNTNLLNSGRWVCIDCPVKSLRDEVKRLQIEVERLRKAFGHTHVADTLAPDNCAMCGLDIRDRIHLEAE